MAELAKERTARQLITSAYVKLSTTDPALYLTALNMEPVETQDPNKTFAIKVHGGKAELLYNPNFVKAIGSTINGDKSLKVLLGLEAARLLLMHATTRIKSNKALSFLASNLTIKDAMRELSGYCETEIYKTIPSFESLGIPEQTTFENYYETLISEAQNNQNVQSIDSAAQQLKQQGGEQQQQQGNGPQESDKSETPQKGKGKKDKQNKEESGKDKNSENGQSENEQEGNENKQEQVKDHKAAFDRHFNPSKNTNAENWEQDEELSEELKDFIRDNIEKIKTCGSLKGKLQEAIIEIAGKNEINPMTIMRLFFANIETIETEETRSRPNRRRGWESPGQLKSMTYHVLCALDESGSVSNLERTKLMVEVNAMTKNAEIDMVSWDTQVYESTLQKGLAYKPRNKFKVANAKGGTSPECLFEFAKKKKYKNIIVLTDGGFPAFDMPGKFNICWVTTCSASDFMKSTGKVVKLKEWR